MRIAAPCTIALLAASALAAAEGDVPRFNTGLEEGVSTVAPLNPVVTGTPSKVLDPDHFPYGGWLSYTHTYSWDPAIVKVGSDYYLWVHHGRGEAGCVSTSDPTLGAGDNVLIYRSPYPDEVWYPAKSSSNSTSGFYPTGCSSASCGGSIQQSELLASLGSDYAADNSCPTANHTGIGGVARVGTTGSYFAVLNDNDGDAHQVDPATGKAVWVTGRDGTLGLDLHCSDTCYGPPTSSGPGPWVSCPSCGEEPPTCSNANNTDPYFSHYAFWRLIGEFTDGKSFNASQDFVLFNGRNIDRIFFIPVPFTIPGDSGAVGFFVRSAAAGWCANFGERRLHVGYVTTGKQVYLKFASGYQNVTGTYLQSIPADISPQGLGTIGHAETTTIGGQRFGVAFEHLVTGGQVVANDSVPEDLKDCGLIGWNGPDKPPAAHTELRYRGFKLNGREWSGWLGNETIDLGPKTAQQNLWTEGRAYRRNGTIGASYPTVLLENGIGRLYYTRDSECSNGADSEIFHVELEDNAAWDAGFRQAASTTAPIRFFPDTLTVSYPNATVQPATVFTPFVGPFGNTTERTDTKWSVQGSAFPASSGGSYSCAHGFKNENLKRIIVSLGGLQPSAQYKVYVDYVVDGNPGNGVDGLQANFGGVVRTFSETLSGADGSHTVIERDESSTAELRRARLTTATSTAQGTLGNLTVDNSYGGANQFEVSRFCGFYVERE